jgi:hypothetical protein
LICDDINADCLNVQNRTKKNAAVTTFNMTHALNNAERVQNGWRAATGNMRFNLLLHLPQEIS